MDEDTKFHWAEGMKYANEGIKLLFLLNGAATISIFTFIANVKDSSDNFVYSMIAFASGAAFGPITMLLAYLTQLQYGNRSNRATWIHYLTYAAVIIALLLFGVGVWQAAAGLFEHNRVAFEGNKFPNYLLRIPSVTH